MHQVESTIDEDRLLDLQVLDRLAKDSAPFPVAELIEIFIEEAKKHRQVICAALRSMDMETLRRESHSVRGSAATFGAEGLRQVAREAEAYCLEVCGREHSPLEHSPLEQRTAKALEAAGLIPAMIDATIGALIKHYALAT